MANYVLCMYVIIPNLLSSLLQCFHRLLTCSCDQDDTQRVILSESLAKLVEMFYELMVGLFWLFGPRLNSTDYDSNQSVISPSPHTNSPRNCTCLHIHNWPLQPFSQDFGLAFHTTHVVCVNYIR